MRRPLVNANVIDNLVPSWLAYLLFAVGIGKAYVEAIKLLGRWPKSAADPARDEEELAISHHH
jgi:hypothetical protein